MGVKMIIYFPNQNVLYKPFVLKNVSGITNSSNYKIKDLLFEEMKSEWTIEIACVQCCTNGCDIKVLIVLKMHYENGKIQQYY